MAATLTAHAVNGRTEADAVFRGEGCSSPRPWSNEAGYAYGWHSHDFHKVLFCLDGDITFHLRDGDPDVRLDPGDRLDIEAGTEHAATVGAEGVSCVEAAR